jgi:hypothetical protein
MAVERKDIEIFFKIEGLEAYITDLQTLDNVLQQVNTATTKAKEATNELETSTQSFEKLEENLSAAEGGVKVLAGGFEALAGAASLLGLEENPFFKELSENVIGVLALSRGAIDASEGVKLLAQNQRLATAAQAAYNAVAALNPYVLLAAAVIALAGALLLYANRTKDTTEETKRQSKALQDLQTELDKTIERERELAQAKGEFDADEQSAINRREASELQNINDTISDQIYLLTQRYSDLSDEEKTELQNLRNQVTENVKKIDQLNFENVLIDKRTAAKKKEAEQEAANERQREANRKAEERRNQQRQLEAELTLKAIEGEREREVEILRRKYEEDLALAKGNAELTKLVQEQFLRDIKALNDQFRLEVAKPLLSSENYFPKEEFETTAERIARLRREIFDTKQLIVSTNNEIGASSTNVADAWSVSYKKAFDQVLEEPSVAADLLRRDTKAAIDFATNLNTIFTKDNEKRAERNFKLQKALSLSSAIINTAEAVTAALTDRTQPSTLIRILQTAAVAAAGAAQIATISRQKFQPNGDGGNTPPPSAPPPPPLPTGVNNPGQTITPGQTSTGQQIQQEPVRAYVLVSDVNNAQQANTQIENLSKL